MLTPPTKPTPPTPPSMNTAPATISSDAVPSSPTTISSSNTKKSEATTSAPSATPKNSVAADKNTSPVAPPPLGNYKEASSQTTLAPLASITTKKSPSPLGFGFLFSVVLLLAIAFTVFRLWKNNAKQRTVLDYSTDSSKELLNLMNSSATASPLPQTIVKRSKTAEKIKSNFEVRI